MARLLYLPLFLCFYFLHTPLLGLRKSADHLPIATQPQWPMAVSIYCSRLWGQPHLAVVWLVPTELGGPSWSSRDDSHASCIASSPPGHHRVAGKWSRHANGGNTRRQAEICKVSWDLGSKLAHHHFCLTHGPKQVTWNREIYFYSVGAGNSKLRWQGVWM